LFLPFGLNAIQILHANALKDWHKDNIVVVNYLVTKIQKFRGLFTYC
jgi:hypothetical protein